MIYTEITPNPASLKFVVDRLLIPHGTADFATESETDEAPLARRLFSFRFVERVFLGKNFVTITKHKDFQWEEVIPAVKDFLKSYLASEQPIVVGELAASLQPQMAEEDEDEVVRSIKSYIESHVRPAVAMDGGDIIYHSFEDGVVHLRLQGSCSGCPSSTITLKNGIETLLTRMVPQVKRVEAV